MVSAVMQRLRKSLRNFPKQQGLENCTDVKEIKVGTMGITNERVTMFEMATTTATTTSTRVTMVTEMIGVGIMFHLKIRKLLLGMVDVVCYALRICCRR